MDFPLMPICILACSVALNESILCLHKYWYRLYIYPKNFEATHILGKQIKFHVDCMRILALLIDLLILTVLIQPRVKQYQEIKQFISLNPTDFTKHFKFYIQHFKLHFKNSLLQYFRLFCRWMEIHTYFLQLLIYFEFLWL